MEQKILLFIIGSNNFMAEMLLEVFRSCDEVEVAGVAKNSMEALDLIKDTNPHIILFDFNEPDEEEIKTLTKSLKLQYAGRPVIVVLSDQSTGWRAKNSVTQDIAGYLVKPIDKNMLLVRIKQIYYEEYINKRTAFLHNSDIAKKISAATAEFLYSYGILSRFRGYKYIKEAMFYIVNDPRSYRPFRKFLYPLIAEQFGTTPQKVETAIRNAIESVWKKSACSDGSAAGSNNILKMFGKKPTNTQFIYTMANHIRSKLNI
ncbi:MAG: response regulator [Clostridiaceae bacterium]|nr:response regulator [Clostridiaceae bacterium]